MTREEAIKVLENERACVLNDACQRAECANCALVMETEDVLSALDLALSALRGPTREMVERMFPGCALCNWGGLDYVGVDSDGIYLSKPSKNEKFRFCPVCGKPLTDEAVDMMLERWKEAVEHEVKAD